MKTETKEIYKCDFCKKVYQKKSACERHENMCKKNPKNDRPCFYCGALEMKELIRDNGYSEYRLHVLFCGRKEVYIYPPQSEIKGNALDFGEDNEPMPRECKEQGC